MPRLIDLDRETGQLQARVPQNKVSVLFRVSPTSLKFVNPKINVQHMQEESSALLK